MTTQTIWIAGASGRLGQELENLLEKNNDYKIIATDKDVDVTDMHAVDQAVDIYRPTVVINCASMSDAQYCEEHMVEAFRVNALGARNLASASRRVNAKMIQLSTDDVFIGNKSDTAFTEFDVPVPTTVYGKSKLAGENYVRELNPKHLIIRSSWVYGSGTVDFYSKVVEHAKKHEEMEVPVDKFSSPTSAKTLSKFIVCLIEKSEYGIYHASSEGCCSRYEFAKAILETLGMDVSLIKGVNSQEEGKTESTLLENLMMKMTEIYAMPEWKEDLTNTVK